MAAARPPKKHAPSRGSGRRDAAPAPVSTGHEPPNDCPACPRLVAFRNTWRAAEPTWFNAPVPSFGDRNARLLIVGLAPGLRGANRTGRPFTGDFAGELLYATLLGTGFAKGTYCADPDDGLELRDCLITNAVRCVPPENKPEPSEILSCRPYLVTKLRLLPRLTHILALGRIAHDQTLAALGERKTAYPFAHGARHELPARNDLPKLTLFDSFHCSRYNTQTGRLTAEMFREVLARIRSELG
ncbi:MAG: uracil-DNA glycosylase [Hyphomicrobium sp.]|nr:uracil-DNA glycosylase [Hyphomicrobium sp.]